MIAKSIQMNIMHVHVVMDSVLFPGIGGKHVHTVYMYMYTCMRTCTHVSTGT